jgi:hypothetical protein
MHMPKVSMSFHARTVRERTGPLSGRAGAKL